MILPLAQLALDVYNDPVDDIHRQTFDKSWQKVETYSSDIGFFATLYSKDEIAVIAICGTNSITDIDDDLQFFFKDYFKQYGDAEQFYNTIKKHPVWLNATSKYITGHSLGGILAKLIAPITEVDTIVFNSPGVKDFLLIEHLPNYTVQQVLTIIAVGDVIGNYKKNEDIGSYKMIKTTNNIFKAHSMALMYEALVKDKTASSWS